MSVVFAEDVPIEKSGEDNLLDVLQPVNMMITDYALLGVAADFLGTYSITKDKSSNYLRQKSRWKLMESDIEYSYHFRHMKD